jgi:hypothetical protein
LKGARKGRRGVFNRLLPLNKGRTSVGRKPLQGTAGRHHRLRRFLESWVPLGRSREAAPRAPWRPPAGFRRPPRRRAQKGRKRGETAQSPRRCERARLQRPLPWQAPVGDDGFRETELGVGRDHQPGPPIGLLWVAHPRRRPAQLLLEGSHEVLHVEAAAVRLRRPQ